MRVSHWSWLGGTRRGRDSVTSQSPPGLEQLEPRLLLSADPAASLIGDFQPVDTQPRQAICIELENGNWASSQAADVGSPGLELDDAAGLDSDDSRSDMGESFGEIEADCDETLSPEETTGELPQLDVCGATLSEITTLQESVAERNEQDPASDTDASDQVQRCDSGVSILESSIGGSVETRGPPVDASDSIAPASSG